MLEKIRLDHDMGNRKFMFDLYMQRAAGLLEIKAHVSPERPIYECISDQIHSNLILALCCAGYKR